MEPEPTAVEEPIVEETAHEPEASISKVDDPNKMMSPEDIEALLAAADSTMPAEEAVEEVAESETVAEEPVAEEPAPDEEKIPIPDIQVSSLDDPNKMMSAEDIEELKKLNGLQ